MTLIPRFISLLLTTTLILAPLAAQTSVAPLEAPTAATPSQVLQLRIVEGESSEVRAGLQATQAFVIEVTGPNGAAVPDAAVAVRLPDIDPTGRFADGTHAAVAYTDQSGRARLNRIRWDAAPGTVAIRVTATRGTAHAGILIQQTLTPVTTVAVADAVPETHTSAPQPPATPLPVAPAFERQPLASDREPLPEVFAPGQPASPIPPRPAQAPLQDPEPAVSVTSASPGESKRSSKTKWIILAAVAAAAGGAGIAMMGKKSSPSNPTGSGMSIGPPTVSVGHP
ncbi:MAG: hypothetical protein ACJ74Z_06790 [Bryobacteraceae bacterium]|jgi:hypothetical protein